MTYMRRMNIIAPLTALLAGITGMLLKRKELAEVYDAVTGLPDKGSALPNFIALLSAAVFAFALIFALMSAAVFSAEKQYEKAFSPLNVGFTLISMLAGILMICDAVPLYFENLYSHSRIVTIIFSVFAAFTGLSVFLLTRISFTRKGKESVALWSLIPALFFCFWMVLVYRENSQSPVIIRFCYICLALVSSTLAFYYSAGYAYSRTKIRMTIITHLMAVYFLPIAVINTAELYERIFLILTGVVIFLQTVRFLSNLKRLEKAEQE